MLDRSRAVSVSLGNRNVPVKFDWQGNIYRISEIQESWRLIGAWWDGEGERTFFRVRTDKQGIYELCFDHAGSNWTLASIED